MSMISSLIDKLNKSADEWNASNMFELARMCREAADTIWELRDDLQRANAENAKLRELCADLYAEMIEYSDAPNYNASVWAPKLCELGIEVD